jgi:hypothetical protein
VIAGNVRDPGGWLAHRWRNSRLRAFRSSIIARGKFKIK